MRFLLKMPGTMLHRPLPSSSSAQCSVTDVTDDRAADLVFFDQPSLRLGLMPSNRVNKLLDGERARMAP